MLARRGPAGAIRGFDPSTLTDLYYTFSGCSSLTTIYADSTWALPSSGISGSQCFCSCSTSLVGRNAAWGKFEYDDDDGGAGNDRDQIDMVELTIVPC